MDIVSLLMSVVAVVLSVVATVRQESQNAADRRYLEWVSNRFGELLDASARLANAVAVPRSDLHFAVRAKRDGYLHFTVFGDKITVGLPRGSGFAV